MSGDDRRQLSLLRPGEHHARPDQVRILTFNVQHANLARSRRQADWLAAQDADVVVLTEVTPGAHAITQALGEHGFTVHLGDDGGADYLTVVASRIGKQEPVPRIRPGYLPHRCGAIRVHLDDGSSVGVVGLYVPSRGPQERRNVDKRLFQDAVAELLPALADDLAVTGPIVIAGDLNVVERGHQPHHAVFGRWEYGFYDAFAAAGYGDAFRHHHPELVDHSWYGRRSGAGYRFDHIFSSPVDAIADCRYVHEPRISGLSDHAAMTAIVTLPTGTL
ncbi:endonuclease/exonuclease/phosphatase family protein [Streptosporangium sp. NPDC002524]|uniref:endonuclease/exonuclease/phosphatase family protein n=1 Tax=Streptosporangium sp. NPDC002524 TaxID=3154537 RepID=UPI00332DCEB5